jgi:porin
MPFFRVGWSEDGAALLKKSVALGIGVNVTERSDLLGVGLQWGQPFEPNDDDQYTAELFYRLQLAKNLAITPDVQLLIDPVLNPEEDLIFVFGLRARLTL